MSAGISGSEAAARQKVLDDLEEFISASQDRLTAMLDRLGWTPEHFMQPRQQTVCPYNADHRMPVDALEKHGPMCELITQGLSKEEATNIVEDTSFFYKDASCVCPVKMDLNLLNSVLWSHHTQNHSVFYGCERVPRTPVEEECLLSREDRCAVAEYIIRRARQANRLKELGQDEMLVSENLADLLKKDSDGERKLDHVEEMAALRDYRRRRQTYRAKNVHITKKSHTEIMREVINNQMEMYSQQLQEESVFDRLKNPHSSSPHESSSATSLTKGESSRSGQRSIESRHTPRSQGRDRTRRSRSHDGSHSRRSRSPEQSSSKRSRSGQRSQSEERKSKKHKHKHGRGRSRSRSRSNSRDSSRKSKHKKSKHKKSKKSKKSRTGDHDHSERETGDHDSEKSEGEIDS